MHERASVERRGRETRESGAAVVPPPSGAFSHVRDHLRVSGVLLDRPIKKETARSIAETGSASGECSEHTLVRRESE